MKKMMLLEDNQDTFSCPVCNKDRFHRYNQEFYKIHWCEYCENYFTIENLSGRKWVYLLNESESKPIRKITESKPEQPIKKPTIKTKPKTKEDKERRRLTIKARKFGLISTEQAIKLGYKPKKSKPLPIQSKKKNKKKK
jgi:ribosomal protein L37AE/L43A